MKKTEIRSALALGITLLLPWAVLLALWPKQAVTAEGLVELEVEEPISFTINPEVKEKTW